MTAPMTTTSLSDGGIVHGPVKIGGGGELEKVSVIVPLFNAERFLRECVESILCQNYANLEILLINDGSTDESGKICDGFAAVDSRVQVIHRLDNLGVAAARNIALDQAQGQYVIFVDADDLLEPEAVSSLVDAMETNDVQLAVGSLFGLVCDHEGVSSKMPMRFTSGVFEATDFSCIPPGAASREEKERHRFKSYHEVTNVWGRLFLRSVVENNNLRFNEKQRWHEDTVFMFEYWSHIHRAIILDRPLYSYRLWAGGDSTSTSNVAARIDNYAMFYERVFSTLERWSNRSLNETRRDLAVRCLKSFYAQCLSGIVLYFFRSGYFVPFRQALKTTRELINRKSFQEALAVYESPQGYSRLVPFFLRNRMPLCVVFAAMFFIGKERLWKKLFPLEHLRFRVQKQKALLADAPEENDGEEAKDL